MVGVTILRVAGDLDRGTAAGVEREARAYIERRGVHLVLDLSRTTFMDTAAVHLMERLSRLSFASGGNLSVVLTCRRSRNLLDLVPPNADVDVVESVAEAVAHRPGFDLAHTA